MKPRKLPQPELPGAAAVFNLAGESALDGWRVAAERMEAAGRAAEARTYALRMQRTFAQCPGFMGGDAPECEGGRGRVLIDPSRLTDALPWLKRRFRVSQNMQASTEYALQIDIASRQRAKKSTGAKPHRLASDPFKAPEQFELALQSRAS